MVRDSDQDILSASPYAHIFSEINKVKVRTKDKYRGESRFPVGTLHKPIQDYPEGEDISENNLKFFKFDTVANNDATSILMVGQSGTTKSTLIKNITYYGSLMPNTKTGVIGLKGNSREWDECNHPRVNPGALYKDGTAIMNFVAGIPSFALRNMPANDRRRVNVMNLSPKEFANFDVLAGLGFSTIARQHMLKLLLEDLKPRELMKRARRLYTNKSKREIGKQTFDNISIVLDNMIRLKFLSHRNNVDINQIWDNGKNWAWGFNNKETHYLSVYVDKILKTVFDRANSTKGRRERYWLVIDDCQKAFGLDPKIYPSVQTGIDALTQWRSLGINVVLGIQSPTMLNEEIYSDIKHYFIFRCGNLKVLQKYIPNKRIIDQVKTLHFDPNRHISECLHVYPDKQTFERFYPVNSVLAN